ncbi:MAG: penicillin-binding protein 2, partial [Candidatus Omnitrophica bacterium]|nr:penicillin-binding protein 2 [Candidatus Omnitrophota bacterium]
MRIRVLSLAIVALFGVLALGLAGLSLVSGRKFRELSDKNCIRLIPQSGSRGKIIDANGKTIVSSILSYDVLVLPQGFAAMQRTFDGLAGIIAIDGEELMGRFRRSYTEPSVPVVVARNIGLEKALAIEERKLDLDGIIVQTNVVRFYPYANLAAHVIGYLSEIDRWRLTKLADYGYKTRDIVGVGGIEERYDYYLRQEDGGLSVEVDHQGRFSRILGYCPPRNGQDIGLTVDVRVQRIVEDALDGYRGSIVVMDPATGAIIAMASRPDFDPALFVKKGPARSFAALFNDPAAPMTNRAIHGGYPPGSVFKPIVAACALELGRANPATTHVCPGFLAVGRRRFKCWNTHHEVDLIEAIAQSCDVYFYKTGLASGARNLHDYAVKLGLGRVSGIELPYEEAGLVPDPLWRRLTRFQRWYDGDTANFAIGQGELLVTPLQIVRMTAVFANGGNLVTPYLVRSIGANDVSMSHRKVLRLGFKKKNIDAVREGLRQVVASPRGTANILADVGVAVAGKTGTAEAPGRGTHAWFSGFFPYERPRYCFCVFL